MTTESKKVEANCSAERLYNFACNFSNFQGSNSPLPFRLALKITPGDDNSCSVVVRAEIEGGNPMVTMMLKPKLRPALDKIAEQIQYYSNGIN